MSCPPFAVSFVYSMLIALVSDYFQWRFISAFLAMILFVIGFAVMYVAEGSMTKYGGLIMLTCGCYSGVPPMFAWIANNSEGHYKRATGIALLVVFNNCAGLTSCFLFPDKDKKNGFHLGKLVNLSIAAVGAFFVLLIEVLTWIEVKKREKSKRDYRVVDLYAKTHWTKDQMRTYLGDDHPEYRLELYFKIG